MGLKILPILRLNKVSTLTLHNGAEYGDPWKPTRHFARQEIYYFGMIFCDSYRRYQ